MKRFVYFLLPVLFFALTASVQAGTKEELMRLQNDINDLRNQFREFEKTLNDSNSGLKTLVEQLNDQTAKSNMLLEKISGALDKLSSGDNSQKEEMLPEIKDLSDKVDEMIMSISALARQVADLKVQSAPAARFVPSDLSSADATFNQALQDLIEGNCDLAIQGFNTYLDLSPSGDKASAARYYIGEAYYNLKQFPQAIEAFTRIIDENADSGKVASALYKRGKAYLEIKESGKAVEDFKGVINKFPEAPEAGLAKAELQGLGISINASSKKR